MASLYDMTIGQDTEFKRILAKAGMDADLVESIIRQPQLADGCIGRAQSLRRASGGGGRNGRENT